MNSRDVIELAQHLIRTPSPNKPGDERAVAGLVQDTLAHLGLPAARVIALDEKRPNLLATLDFGPGGRHLVLNGHLDTKPVGDARWGADPFGADLDGDRLYGLGSADMKGAVAAMLVAAAQVATAAPPRGRLSLLFTADEEDGAALGAKHVAATVPLDADAVVIGEPGGIDADFDRLHLVSRGICRVRVVARAVQGHSSLSGRPGVRNAGVDAARAVLALADAPALDAPPNPDSLTGWHPTVNAGLAYHGGVGFGVLPDRIAVDTEVRLLPGMRREDVLKALSETVAPIGPGVGIEPDEWIDWLPAAAVAADHPVADAARRALRRALGAVPPDSVFPGTTDATWFQELQGLSVLPALGPGLLRRAHGADECVSVEAVRRCVTLYRSLALAFCAPEPSEPSQ
jgi:acetylornithine deacetylase/succinyl-diaminopimelate desuccinylase-like protein